MHALVAARLGDAEMALRYLREAAATGLDLDANSAGGVRIAGLGGIWQAVLLGFATLDLMGDTLSIDPKLPPQWRSLSFNVCWRGRSLGMNKKAEVVRVYLPPDANCLLSVTDHCLRSRNTIRVQQLAGKPAPDTFLMAAKLLGCEPERTVVIEDAISGVQAGANGKFGLVIGVARKGNAEELRQNGAHVVVNDLSELVDPPNSTMSRERLRSDPS